MEGKGPPSEDAVGGALQVINQVSGGSVSTTIVNTASGLDINQLNTTTVSLLNNVQFVDQIRSGGPLGGTPHIPLGLLTGLIGVIAR